MLVAVSLNKNSFCLHVQLTPFCIKNNLRENRFFAVVWALGEKNVSYNVKSYAEKITSVKDYSAISSFATTLHYSGAILLSWRRSWPRAILYFGATNLLVCSAFGMVRALFCACGRGVGMAHVRHRRLTPTLYAFYHIGHFHHLLGLMASTLVLYKRLLSKQRAGRGLAIHA